MKQGNSEKSNQTSQRVRATRTINFSSLTKPLLYKQTQTKATEKQAQNSNNCSKSQHTETKNQKQFLQQVQPNETKKKLIEAFYETIRRHRVRDKPVLKKTKYTAVSTPEMDITSCSVEDRASLIHANGFRVLDPPSHGSKPLRIRLG